MKPHKQASWLSVSLKYVLQLIFGLLILLSACSSDDKDLGPAPDAAPPAAVQDLAFQDSTGSTVALIWTAPGDDGMDGQADQYEIRYSMSLLSEAAWDSARIVYGPPVPKVAGQVESLSVSGLADGTWHFGLKAADEVPNWSAMSNVAITTLVDTIAPGRVTDLAGVFATVASVELNWTAPGDDGDEGNASEYDLRYSLDPISEETWEDAIRLEDVPAPSPSGTSESFTVTGLELGTTYSFAIKTVDDMLNESELSHVLSRSTATLERLTSSPSKSRAVNPAWSPDGQNIVFHANWGAEYSHMDLYLILANGGDPVRLTHEPDRAFSACWSPDGTRLAFVSSRPRYTEIYVMDAVPGAAAVQLTSFQGGRHLSGFTWSPDASRFAYVNTYGLSPTNEIYSVSYAGGSSRLLIEGWKIRGDLDWSPDGSRIAYSSNRSGNWDIWTITMSGWQTRQLTDDPAVDTSPAWSPDGSQIAFSSSRAAGDLDLWLMSSFGQNQTPLTTDPAHEFNPSWSPDGSRIVFESSVDGTTDIWVLSSE